MTEISTSDVFNDLHTIHNNHDREHYELVLENITFEQLQIIKEYLPYLLNISELAFIKRFERFDKHQKV